MKNLVLLSFLTLIVLGCKQENKSENQLEDIENLAITALSSSRYTIGDSVRIRFSQKISELSVSLDNKELAQFVKSGDSLSFNTSGEKPGWHKLIVKGSKEDKSAFSDTLSVELISEIVPQEIKYTVVGSFPHLKTSFTEGLEFYKGELYEGTGENGKSQLLKLDVKTGAAIKSVSLDEKYFGEGITVVKDKIYQLTWQSGVCFRYNLDFTLDKTFTYYFQGWGLTHHNSVLMMSDGSNTIHFYNTDFEKTGDLQVYDNTGPVRQINELEYVDGFIYANIFETNRIIKIDASSGKVVAYLNMDGIIPAQTDARKDVLNGIAYQASEQAFYITGKNWPLLFKIKLTNQPIGKKVVAK